MRFSRAFSNQLIKEAATFTPEYNQKYKEQVENLSKLRPADIHKQLIPNGEEVRVPFNIVYSDESFRENLKNDKVDGNDKSLVRFLEDELTNLRQIDYVSGNVLLNITKPDGKEILSKKPIGKLLTEYKDKSQAKFKQYKDLAIKGLLALGLLNNKIDPYKTDYDDAKQAFNSYIQEKYKDNIDIPVDSNYDNHIKLMSNLDNWRNNYHDMLYIERYLKTFSNSPYRQNTKQQSLEVVISSNPHDIAQMSTYKPWTSCMQLGHGAYHESVFCSVAGGDLVAYLITKGSNMHEDINVPIPPEEKPASWTEVPSGQREDNHINANIKARVLIRNFTNQDGKALFVPESRVYGQLATGLDKEFLSVVKNYIISIQGSIPEVEPNTHTMPGKEVTLKDDKKDPNIEKAYAESMELLKSAYSKMRDQFLNFKEANGEIEAIKSFNLLEIENILMQAGRDAYELQNHISISGYAKEIDRLVMSASYLDNNFIKIDINSFPFLKLDYDRARFVNDFKEGINQLYGEIGYLFRQLDDNPPFQKKFKGYSDTFNLYDFKAKPEPKEAQSKFTQAFLSKVEAEKNAEKILFDLDTLMRTGRLGDHNFRRVKKSSDRVPSYYHVNYESPRQSLQVVLDNPGNFDWNLTAELHDKKTNKIAKFNKQYNEMNDFVSELLKELES